MLRVLRADAKLRHRDFYPVRGLMWISSEALRLLSETQGPGSVSGSLKGASDTVPETGSQMDITASRSTLPGDPLHISPMLAMPPRRLDQQTDRAASVPIPLDMMIRLLTELDRVREIVAVRLPDYARDLDLTLFEDLDAIIATHDRRLPR